MAAKKHRLAGGTPLPESLESAWPAGTSSADVIVTHLTDQPFPIISLKLLSQMAVVPSWAGPGPHHQIPILC